MLEYLRKLMRVKSNGSYTIVIARTLIDIMDLKPGDTLSESLVSHEGQKSILIKRVAAQTAEEEPRKINVVT